MAHYNRIKTQKIAPVGTIMPWTGGSAVGEEADDIPRGWLICNAGMKGLNAADYPILASIIGNEYGPFPDVSIGQQLGINFGIVNSFPYNKDLTAGHVDTFDLPNLNQVALVDLEMSMIDTDSSNGDSDVTVVGPYVSRNGSTGTQAKTLVKSDIDLSFNVEPSNNLAGRITGIIMDPPIYFTSAYVIPRKLGIDHTPRHTHRPASEADTDQFWSAYPNASPVLEFIPGKAVRANSFTQTTTVQPASQRGDTLPAQQFNPGYGQFTWYDSEDGGTSMVLTNRQWNIGSDTDGDGDVDTKKKIPDTDVYPGTPATTRTIEGFNQTEFAYQDDYSAVAAVAADAHVGAFPPPGKYQGRRNYYASPDINRTHRGSEMPMTYINDMQYSGAQPVNTNVPETGGKTFATTLNHPSERWAGDLRAHNHDAMEVSMGSGLSIPATLLVNDVSTGTTNPVTQETALTVAVNPNTPSLTMMYIMRAF